MNDTNDNIEDFVGVDDISKPMSKDEYDSFLKRMSKKGYFNDVIEKDGIIVNANDQIAEGFKILKENNIGI